jgi:pyruvate dehydrogenase E1 component alpha subunit
MTQSPKISMNDRRPAEPRPVSDKTTDSATTTVARFEIHHTRFLDRHGNLVAPLPAFARDPQALVTLYRSMMLVRLFDAKAVALQRTGQLGTYAAALGEEAVAVAVGAAMLTDDVLLPGYRHIGAQFLRGVRPSEILLYWGGDERGMHYAACPRDFPMCIPIASQAPHAVGVAYAMKRRREPRVAVCMLGDGATSKGDFYEALNAAGVWRVPVVFVVNNNQYAISVPRRQQTAAETIAQKAIAAGVGGEQCDGNDVIAVRHCVEQALTRARRGDGPSLIEALTYRLSDHTTADDARRYRKEEEVESWRQQDPVARLRGYLASVGAWSDSDEQALLADCARQVEDAVREYQSLPPLPPESMFDHLYETLPPALAAQREQVLSRKK